MYPSTIRYIFGLKSELVLQDFKKFFGKES